MIVFDLGTEGQDAIKGSIANSSWDTQLSRGKHALILYPVLQPEEYYATNAYKMLFRIKGGDT